MPRPTRSAASERYVRSDDERSAREAAEARLARARAELAAEARRREAAEADARRCREALAEAREGNYARLLAGCAAVGEGGVGAGLVGGEEGRRSGERSGEEEEEAVVVEVEARFASPTGGGSAGARGGVFILF